MVTKELEFESMAEFYKWKEQMEDGEAVSFVSATRKKNSHYYICHRSGHSQAKANTGQRARAPSVKIGHTCPASINVTQLPSGRISVKFHETHTGHNLSVGSLRLTAADKGMVGALIQQGLSDRAILKKVRDSFCEGYIKRVHLLDMQDINNLRRVYKLDDSYGHVDDAISVGMWVDQQRSMGFESSVLYYKAQGKDDDRETAKLPVEAFMLIIMTPFQREMAIKHCGEKVLIDTTHGTNKYKFDLTTLLTVDEFGVGVPVAYCLSTHTDSLSMKVFFDNVEKHVGKITAKVFMSDDCDAYYNAWREVMGDSAKRLLCSWHVDKAWQRNIHSKVCGDMFLKSWVYKALKIIQLHTNEDRFRELLQGFLNWCLVDDRTTDFGLYFVNNYVGRDFLWAFCFRAGLGLNTNMYLEAHHKTLKYSYLLKKVNNRVDKAIQALLLRTRDTLFERLRRLSKGTLKSARIAAITSSHKRSNEIRQEMITFIEEGVWHVQPSSSGPQYTVTATDAACTNCPLACVTCKVCIHKYNCTCADNLVRGNMCKHIHAVIGHQENTGPFIQDRFTREADVQELAQMITKQPSSIASGVDARMALAGRIAQMKDLVESVSPETASSLLAASDKIIMSMKADIKSQKDDLPLRKISAHEKCKRQRKFYCVRKKTVVHKPNLSIPSTSETMAITQVLLHDENINTENQLPYVENFLEGPQFGHDNSSE